MGCFERNGLASKELYRRRRGFEGFSGPLRSQRVKPSLTCELTVSRVHSGLWNNPVSTPAYEVFRAHFERKEGFQRLFYWEDCFILRGRRVFNVFLIGRTVFDVFWEKGRFWTSFLRQRRFSYLNVSLASKNAVFAGPLPVGSENPGPIKFGVPFCTRQREVLVSERAREFTLERRTDGPKVQRWKGYRCGGGRKLIWLDGCVTQNAIHLLPLPRERVLLSDLQIKPWSVWSTFRALNKSSKMFEVGYHELPIASLWNLFGRILLWVWYFLVSGQSLVSHDQRFI